MTDGNFKTRGRPCNVFSNLFFENFEPRQISVLHCFTCFVPAISQLLHSKSNQGKIVRQSLINSVVKWQLSDLDVPLGLWNAIGLLLKYAHTHIFYCMREKHSIHEWNAIMICSAQANSIGLPSFSSLHKSFEVKSVRLGVRTQKFYQLLRDHYFNLV